MGTLTIPTSSKDPDKSNDSNATVDGSMQLLLVEGDELICAGWKQCSQRQSSTSMRVSSAAAARAMMTTVVFPIVIVDRILADSDGISLIGELRRCYAQHRVFLMLYSALDSEEERRKGIAARADEYLSKRASDGELLARLTAAGAVVPLRSK